jgi:carotenoid 1,2-hydratase
MNVALYGLPGPGWAMTERARPALLRDATTLRIGPSAMEWQNGALVVEINEITVPRPRRLRGRIVLTPAARFDSIYEIDTAGLHRWQPMAPCARVEVAFDRPGWAWHGHGYLDSNDGDAPLEQGFTRWDWSRASLAGGDAVVLYDALRQDGSSFAWAGRFGPDGQMQRIQMPPSQPVQPGLWRMQRRAHADAATQPHVLRSFEDSPFYTRSAITTRLCGEDVVAVHESLSLDRFRQRWVQLLLPFRMPRRGGG